MLTLFNTLTRKKEPFHPLTSHVRMFVCGPTVYDYIHIGNARTFVFFDTFAKYLRYKGYELTYLQNITDIDDKIIKKARDHTTDPATIAKEYTQKFLDDAQHLGITAVDRYASATDHIDAVVKQVKTLIDKGHAYFVPEEGYYFDLSTFAEYGKLSGRTSEMAYDGVSRIDEGDFKRNSGDFCLWKLSKPDEPSWDTEIGAGRPGWHIEDTAITEEYFGPQYDIHGGGQDLIFPHHEAEITQQEAASGITPFVRYWMHAGFLVNKDQKMSKSLGNFTTLHDVLSLYTKETLRFYFLSAHYRSELDYSENNLKAAEAAVQRLSNTYSRLNTITKADSDTHQLGEILDNTKTEFEAAMDDDINTPRAIASIFELLRIVNPLISEALLTKNDAERILDLLLTIDTILGIIPTSTEAIPSSVEDLVHQREAARIRKDFETADHVRDTIQAEGYTIDDTIYGPLIKKIH